MAGNYGDAFYAGVTFNVQNTGQAAVDGYRQGMLDAKAAVAALQSQIAASGTATAKQLADLAALGAAATRASAAYDAASRVIAGKSAEAANGVRGLADAALQASRGFEDFATGGFLGVLNNLPGVARGIGTAFGVAAPQIALAETAVTVFGTSAYIAWKNWDRIKALFDDGLGPKLLPDLAELQKQLKELEKIPTPSLVQQGDIERLEKAVELAERLKAADRAQAGPTQEDKRQGEIVNEGIRESTRGDRSKIDELIIHSRDGETSPELRAIRQEYADALAKARRLDAGTGDNLNESEFRATQEQGFYDRQQAQIATDNENRKRAAEQLRTKAGLGDDAALRELAGILAKNQDFARNQGIDVPKLAKALADARAVQPGYTKEAEQAAEKAKKAAEDAAKKLLADTVRDVKRGFDDGAADAIQAALAAGTSADEAKAAAKAAMLPGLRQRGVGAGILDAVAEQIADDAKNEALNRANEGERSKLQVARDAAKAKEDREKAQRENEAQQEVNRHVAAAGGGFRDQAEAELYRAMSGGGDVGATRRAQFGHVAAGLADRGVPMEIITAVADAILKQAEDHATNAIQSGSQPRLIREARTATAAATRKQVNDLAPGYLPGIENFLAARADAIGRGVPVARDAADAQRLARSGEAYLPPAAESRRQLTEEVAAHLGQSRQDRNLAGPLVERGIESFRDKIGRGSGAGVDPLVSAAGIMRETQGHVLQLQQNAAQQAGILQGLQRGNDVLRRNNQQLHQATQRNRMRRPPLIGR